MLLDWLYAFQNLRMDVVLQVAEPEKYKTFPEWLKNLHKRIVRFLPPDLAAITNSKNDTPAFFSGLSLACHAYAEIMFRNPARVPVEADDFESMMGGTLGNYPIGTFEEIRESYRQIAKENMVLPNSPEELDDFLRGIDVLRKTVSSVTEPDRFREYDLRENLSLLLAVNWRGIRRIGSMGQLRRAAAQALNREESDIEIPLRDVCHEIGLKFRVARKAKPVPDDLGKSSGDFPR